MKNIHIKTELQIHKKYGKSIKRQIITFINKNGIKENRTITHH